MEFSRPEYWSGQPFPFPGDLSNPGIGPRSPAMQVDSLPAEPQGKLKNTGVGNPSLFHLIFLTQESNQGLLHCRQILYQLRYQVKFILKNTQKEIKQAGTPRYSFSQETIYFPCSAYEKESPRNSRALF